MSNEGKNVIRIVTHSGNFHADDVCAVATLTILHRDENIEIIRTRDPELISSGDYVVDVGGEYTPEENRFDHHQEGYAGERKNGITYAAFGLVWRKYGAHICDSQEVADVIDKRVVQPIDATDNGIQVSSQVHDDVRELTLHSLVALFRPTWREPEEESLERFKMLVDAAATMIERNIVVARDWIDGAQYTRDAYESAEDKRLIVLENRYPWQDVLIEYPEPLYVLYPGRVQGYWRVKAIRKDADSFENRKDLPEGWAGKRDEELEEATGVEGAVFCHNKRFLVVAENRGAAMKLAQQALDN